jgi:hypothetical protein
MPLSLLFLSGDIVLNDLQAADNVKPSNCFNYTSKKDK